MRFDLRIINLHWRNVMKILVIAFVGSSASMGPVMALPSDQILVAKAPGNAHVSMIAALAHSSKPIEPREQALLVPPITMSTAVGREQRRFSPPDLKPRLRAPQKRQTFVGSKNTTCYGGTDHYWRHIQATY